MAEGKHTPTPWRISETDAAVVLAADHKDPFGIRYAVAFCEPCVPLNGDGDYGQFNAAQIVRAVNAHDDLVAALKQCASELGVIHHADGDMAHAECHCAGLKLANAALAKATLT
jgi:hypothetical protein